jgi:phospholipid/cholesterol/gamma-HCH transport system substrate-binding protein
VRSRWNLPIVLAYAAASLAVLGYLMVQMGGQFLFQPTYRLTAMFDTGTQLVSGDDVTISGVKVGQVTDVAPAPGGARVALTLHQRYAPLYRDSRAMIKSKNLLGETYVELHRGTSSAGTMADGATIPKDRTITPVEIDQVLDVLDQDTRQQLVGLIDNLGESVSGRGQDLNSSAGSLKVVAQSLQTIARAVADQNAQMDTLLTSLQKVLETLAAWHSELRQLIGDWDSVMRTLASKEQDLQGVVVNEDQVMAIVDQALSGNTGSLHTAIAQSPQLIDNANHYSTNGAQIFGRIADNSTAVTDLFYELASVMSGTGPEGNYWRVYPVSGGLGTISQPLLPPPASPSPGGGR